MHCAVVIECVSAPLQKATMVGSSVGLTEAKYYRGKLLPQPALSNLSCNENKQTADTNRVR